MTNQQLKKILEKLDVMIGQMEEINNKLPLLNFSVSDTVSLKGPVVFGKCNCHEQRGMTAGRIPCPVHGQRGI